MKNPIKYVSANIAHIFPDDTILKVDCSAQATALFFPYPSSSYDGVVTVKKVDSGSNTVTIFPHGGETIDGAASVTLVYEGDYKTFAPVRGGFSVVDTYSPSISDRTAATALVAPFGAPIAPVAATGTLTFIGAVSDGETVTIGGDVYEFDTDEKVEAGNILVDISGGATAPDAVTALVAAITASDTQGVGGADGEDDTVVLTAATAGAAANAIATTADCENANFTKSTLEGGADGTVGAKGQIMVDASKIYVSTDVSTVSVSHWESVGIS
jgi:hypothetical protein